LKYLFPPIANGLKTGSLFSVKPAVHKRKKQNADSLFMLCFLVISDGLAKLLQRGKINIAL